MKVRSLGRGNGLSECELEALLGAYQQYEFISQIFGAESQLSIFPVNLSLAQPLHQFLFFGDIKKKISGIYTIRKREEQLLSSPPLVVGNGMVVGVGALLLQRGRQCFLCNP